MHYIIMNSNTQTREIVKLGTANSYPQARKMAAERGMELAPYLLVDRHVAKVGGVLVAKELLAHPEKNGVFQKGRDINDSITNLSIPASEVPKDAFGRTGTGMLVVPRNGNKGLEPSKGRIYIHPSSIVVFTGMIQTPNEWVPGKPHETLGVPVAISPEEFARLSEEEKRWFLRIAGEGVRPLVRGDYGWGGYVGRFVYACFGADRAFGVAGVSASDAHAASGMAPIVRGAEQSETGAENAVAPPENTQLKLTRDGGKLIVEGTPEQLDALEMRLRQ